MIDYSGLTTDQLIAIARARDEQVANLRIMEEQLREKVEQYRVALEKVVDFGENRYASVGYLVGIAKQALEEK